MSDVKEGDRVKAVGNHCYKGKDGVVTQCEDIEGETYVHATLDGACEHIIMRPGQYKVVKRADGKSQDRLSPEIIAQIRRVANNTQYNIAVRQKVLRNVKAEIETALTLLDYEEQGEKEALDHEQEQATLFG